MKPSQGDLGESLIFEDHNPVHRELTTTSGADIQTSLYHDIERPSTDSNWRVTAVLDSKSITTWLVDWLPMRLIGLPMRLRGSSYARHAVYAVMIVMVFGLHGIGTLNSCGLAPVGDPRYQHLSADPAARTILCPFNVMGMFVGIGPLLVYPSFPAIFGQPRIESENTVRARGAASNHGGALALLTANCPEVEVSVKVWLQWIRRFLVIGATFGTYSMGYESLFRVMPGFGIYHYNGAYEYGYAWTLFFLQPLCTIVSLSLCTAWFLSLLFATWLVEESCKTIQEHVHDGAVLTDARWRDQVLTPVKTLATSSLPTLSTVWGVNLGLAFMLIVAIELCVVMVSTSPLANEPIYNDAVTVARSNIPMILFPLALISVPARLSTRFKKLKYDISLLRFEYNADIIRRVNEFEAALERNEVGFKIMGQMLSSLYRTYYYFEVRKQRHL